MSLNCLNEIEFELFDKTDKGLIEKQNILLKRFKIKEKALIKRDL